MKDQSIIRSIPLPLVSNLDKKFNNISHESKKNLKSLMNIIQGKELDDIETILPNAKTRFPIKINLYKQKISRINKTKETLTKPFTQRIAITEANLIIDCDKDKDKETMLMLSAKVKRKTKTLTIPSYREEAIDTYNTHEAHEAHELNDAQQPIQSRNRHLSNLNLSTHFKLLTPSKQSNQFKGLIDAQCNTVYNNCKTFDYLITTKPNAKHRQKINAALNKGTDNETLYQLLKEKKGKKNGNAHNVNVNGNGNVMSKANGNPLKESTIIRESNLVSKVNASLGFNSLNILKKIINKRPKPTDYSQAVALTEFTEKRRKMVNKANNIMRKSEYKTRQCLKSMYEFEAQC